MYSKDSIETQSSHKVGFSTKFKKVNTSKDEVIKLCEGETMNSDI